MNKDILEQLYPVGSIYHVGFIWTYNLEKAKKKLPKIGKWEYMGLDFVSFIFKRIK